MDESHKKYTIEGVIDKLERRSASLQKQAKLFLLGINSLLVIGILVIFLAGWINDLGFSENSSFEEKMVNLQKSMIENDIALQKNDSVINIFESEIQNVREFLADSFAIYSHYRPKNSLDGLDEYFAMVDNFGTNYLSQTFEKTKLPLDSIFLIHQEAHNILKKKFREQFDLKYQNQLKKLNSNRLSLEKDIEIVQDRLDEERLGLVSGNNSKPYITPEFLENSITRFGVLILIFFLVKILIPLYRYNLKLSSYYQGKADSLSLLQSGKLEGKIDYQILLSSLTPDIHFGNEPETPIDKMIQLSKVIKN